jgi:multidrug efflux pump subunit AcrA (membrane-fusion protein)
MTHDVFLSYSPGSRKIAEALTVWLEQEGFRCFAAFRDMPPGASWVDVVPETIKNSRVFVTVFAPEVKNAGPVYEEISVAVENARPMLPYRLRAFSPEAGYAEDWQELEWQEAFPFPQKTFGKLTRQIGKLLIKDFAVWQQAAPPPHLLPPQPASAKGPFAWLLQGIGVLVLFAILFALVPLLRSGNLKSWQEDWKVFFEGEVEGVRTSLRAKTDTQNTPADPQASPQSGTESPSATQPSLPLSLPAPSSAPASPSPRGAPTSVGQPVGQSVPGSSGSAAIPASLSPAVQETIRVLGVLRSANEISVCPEISGRIIEVYASEGDVVQKGKSLAKTEIISLEQQAVEARAALEKAQKHLPEAQHNLADATATVERNRKRREETGGLSPSKLEWESGNAGLERATASVAAASAAIEEAQLKLKLIESDIAKANLLSPVNGVVLKRDCFPGQIISTDRPVLFVIASSLERLKLQCSISEKDIARVIPGQAAVFQTADFPARSFPAKVVKVGSVPVTATPNGNPLNGVKVPVAYPVDLEVENSAGILRPGMAASVEFH